MVKLIEVEPGAPLPPEAPPWAERYELVQKPGLSDDVRRGLQTAGAALLVGGAAAALLMGTDAGFAHLFAALAMLVGVGLYCGGLIAVPPGAKYVPSPRGRYVAVEEPQPPHDPAVQEEARGSARRFGWFDAIWTAVMVTTFGYLYSVGILSIEWASVVVLAYLAPPAVEAVKRRLKSEAEVSERFLQASDPRTPIASVASGAATPETPLPAPGAAAPEERQPSGAE